MTIMKEANAPVQKGRKKLTILLAITIIAAAVIYSTPGILIQNQHAKSNSWIKIGAYSTYEGNVAILAYTITFNARMEIMDLNETHAEVQTKINMSSQYGSNINTTTMWMDRSNMTFQPEGLTLTNTHTEQVSIPKLGTRTCTVYEYQNQDITTTYFIDNQLQWPLKMTISSPTIEEQSYSININLVETNIPELS
jgi:hypothetical protein